MVLKKWCGEICWRGSNERKNTLGCLKWRVGKMWWVNNERVNLKTLIRKGSIKEEEEPALSIECDLR
jgi:hypothetical protein